MLIALGLRMNIFCFSDRSLDDFMMIRYGDIIASKIDENRVYALGSDSYISIAAAEYVMKKPGPIS